MRLVAQLLCALSCWLIAPRALAGSGEDRFVVVLKAGGGATEPWPSGTQAVISELLARGYELIVRTSVAKEASGLQAELEFAAAEPATVGAVAVFRQEGAGVAYVYTAQGGPISISASVEQGTLADSSVALRVSELFRDPAIPPLPSGERSPRGAAPPLLEPDPLPAAPDRGAVGFGGGAAFTTDLAGPVPLLGLWAASPRLSSFSLDAVFAITPLASFIETSAGSVELSLQQVRAHVVFDPWSERDVGMVLALGGGLIWAQESASGDAGYVGQRDSARVGVVSARAAVFARADAFRFVLSLEPGLVLPELRVHADGEELARIGRPWTELWAGLTWQL